MTGPEHYQAAERHAQFAEDADPYEDGAGQSAALGLAQVHATLALAGAIGLIIAAEAEPPEADCAAWAAAIGAQPAAS